MKILITVLITILVIFILLFAAKGIFGIGLKFEKTNSEAIQKKDTMKEVGSSINSEQTKKRTTETFQDITKLAAQVLKPGTGDRQVKVGDKITVHYVGKLLDGTKFDSSIDKGKPFSLIIGIGQVIPGWDKGIIGMKVGEQRRLFIPSELAYGERGAGNIIKPNADLIFDVELLSIDNPAKNEENINNAGQSIPTTTNEMTNPVDSNEK